MKETNHGCNRAGAALRRPCLTNPSNGETAVPCFVGLAGSKGPDTVFSETAHVIKQLWCFATEVLLAHVVWNDDSRIRKELPKSSQKLLDVGVILVRRMKATHWVKDVQVDWVHSRKALPERQLFRGRCLEGKARKLMTALLNFPDLNDVQVLLQPLHVFPGKAHRPTDSVVPFPQTSRLAFIVHINHFKRLRGGKTEVEEWSTEGGADHKLQYQVGLPMLFPSEPDGHIIS